MLTLPKNALLLDIETSGLKRQTDVVISIGVIFNDEKSIPTLKHWFLDTKEEEKSLLESFLLFLKNIETIYTYHGKGFDYPFLLSRMACYGLDTSHFLKLKLIDMKDALKHFTTQRKSLESALDFKRKSTTSGREILKLYRTYEAYKEPLYRNLILKHQEDELNSLLAFLELYRTLIQFNASRCISETKTPDYVFLEFKVPSPFAYNFTGNAFNWRFSYKKGGETFFLCIPLIEVSLKQYVEPVKDYYFIDSQQQLMHRSLAQFIPASLKRRATKEECAITKTSTYLQIYTTYKLTLPIWYAEDKSMYIESEQFVPELLTTQLFYLFFQRTTSKEAKALYTRKST